MTNEVIVRVITYVTVKVNKEDDPCDKAMEFVLENSNHDFAKSCDYEELWDND
jgi:hypothetical protein